MICKELFGKGVAGCCRIIVSSVVFIFSSHEKLNSTFRDYEICAEFPSVVYNGAWFTISFVRMGEGEKSICKAVFGHRIGSRVYSNAFEYEITKVLDFANADEGNTFYRAILKTKRVSKNRSIYYDLRKAIDSLPSDSRLAQSFVGA